MPNVEEFLLNASTEDIRRVSSGTQRVLPGFEIEDYQGRMNTIDPISQGWSPHEHDGLDELRAQNQSRWEKWGNATAKMGVLAGATFLDGTLGTIAGLVNVAATGEGNAFIDNPISNAIVDFTEKSEEWLPNYRTKEEKDNNWWENLGTANFWADTVLKNMGFTIGAVAVGALTGSIGSASLGRMFGVKSLKELSKQTFKSLAKLGVKSSDDLLKGIANGTIKSDEFAMALLKEGKALRNLNYANQVLASTASSLGEARFEALHGMREFEDNMIRKGTLTFDEIEKSKKEVGNGIFLGNMAVLSLGQFAQFRNVFSPGFKNVSVLRNRVVKDGKKFKFYNPSNPKLSKIYNSALYASRGLKNFGIEGSEEMSQAIISHTNKTYYETINDPAGSATVMDLTSAYSKGMAEVLGDPDNWVEFFVGGIVGGVGTPTITNRGFEWAGGAVKDIKEYNKKRATTQATINSMNNALERVEKDYNIAKGDMSLEAAKSLALENNDMFGFKTLEAKQIALDMVAFADAGRLDEYKEFIKSTANMTDEQLEKVLEQTVDKETGEKYFGDMTVEQLRTKINERAQKLSKLIESFESAKKTVDLRFPQVSNDLRNEMLFNIGFLNTIEKRSKSVVDKIINDGIADARLPAELKETEENRNKLGIKSKQLEEIIEVNNKSIADNEEALDILNNALNEVQNIINEEQNKLNEIVTAEQKLQSTTESSDETIKIKKLKTAKDEINKRLNSLNEAVQKITELANELTTYKMEQLDNLQLDRLESEYKDKLKRRKNLKNKKRQINFTPTFKDQVAPLLEKIAELEKELQDNLIARNNLIKDNYGAKKTSIAKENRLIKKELIKSIEERARVLDELYSYAAQTLEKRGVEKESLQNRNEFLGQLNNLLLRKNEFNALMKELGMNTLQDTEETKKDIKDLEKIFQLQFDLANTTSKIFTELGNKEFSKSFEKVKDRVLKVKDKTKVGSIANNTLFEHNTEKTKHKFKELNDEYYLINQEDATIHKITDYKDFLENYTAIEQAELSKPREPGAYVTASGETYLYGYVGYKDGKKYIAREYINHEGATKTVFLEVVNGKINPEWSDLIHNTSEIEMTDQLEYAKYEVYASDDIDIVKTFKPVLALEEKISKTLIKDKWDRPKTHKVFVAEDPNKKDNELTFSRNLILKKLDNLKNPIITDYATYYLVRTEYEVFVVPKEETYYENFAGVAWGNKIEKPLEEDVPAIFSSYAPMRGVSETMNSTGHFIGSVNNGVLTLNEKSTDVDNNIELQKLINKTNLNNRKLNVRIVSGKDIFGETWEDKERELYEAGYNPGQARFGYIIDTDGNRVSDNYVTLSSVAPYKPATEAKDKYDLTRIKGTDTFVSADGKIEVTYPNIFTKEVQFLKPKFATKSVSEDKTEELESILPEQINETSNIKPHSIGAVVAVKEKSNGIPLTGEPRLLSKFNSVNKTTTTIEVVEKNVEVFDSYGNEIPVQPADFKEVNTVIEALKLFCSQSKLKNGRVLSHGATNYKGKNLFKIISDLIYFSTTDNLKQEALDKKVNLIKRIKNLTISYQKGKIDETTYNLEKQNLTKSIDDLYTIEDNLKMSENHYLGFTKSVNPSIGGDMIVGTDDKGNRQIVPLFDQDKIKKGELEINPVFVDLATRLLNKRKVQVSYKGIKENKPFTKVTLKNGEIEEKKYEHYTDYLIEEGLETQLLDYENNNANVQDGYGNPIEKSVPNFIHQYLTLSTKDERDKYDKPVEKQQSIPPVQQEPDITDDTEPNIPEENVQIEDDVEVRTPSPNAKRESLTSDEQTYEGTNVDDLGLLDETPDDKIEPSDTDNTNPSVEFNEDNELYKLKELNNRPNKENIDAAREWFEERFPGVSFKTVKQLIDGKAYGAFKKTAVFIYENAPEGTTYHEAFHVVADLFLTKQEKQELLNEAFSNLEMVKEFEKISKIYEKETKNPNDIMWEVIAEDFADWRLGNPNKAVKGRPKETSFFKRLWRFFKELFNSKKSKLLDTYIRIESGDFKHELPIRDNTNTKYSLRYEDSNPVYNTAEFRKAALNNTHKLFTTGIRKKFGSVLKLNQLTAEHIEDIYKAIYIALKKSDNPNSHILAKHWNTTKKNHIEYLNTFGINIELKETEYIDENDTGEKIQYEALKLSPAKTATPYVKFMLSSLFREKKGKMALDRFGFPKFHNYKELHNILVNACTNVKNVEEMIGKINELSKIRPEFKMFLKRLNIEDKFDVEKIQDIEDYTALTQIFKSVVKKEANYRKTGTFKNTFSILNITRENARKVNKMHWLSQHRVMHKYSMPGKRDESLGFAKLPLSSLYDMVGRVNVSKLVFTQSRVHKYYKGTKNYKGYLKTILLYLGVTRTNFVDLMPHDELVKLSNTIGSGIHNASKRYKAQGIDYAQMIFSNERNSYYNSMWQAIADAYIDYSPNVSENRATSMEGEVLFGKIMFSSFDKILLDIKTLSAEEFDSKYPFEKDPYVQNSLIYNVLKTDKKKLQNLDTIINLGDIQKGVGIEFKDLPEIDKFRLNFNFSKDGYYPIFRAADNKIERYIYLGDIITDDYKNEFIQGTEEIKDQLVGYLMDEVQLFNKLDKEQLVYQFTQANSGRGVFLDLIISNSNSVQEGIEYVNNIIKDPDFIQSKEFKDYIYSLVYQYLNKQSSELIAKFLKLGVIEDDQGFFIPKGIKRNPLYGTGYSQEILEHEMISYLFATFTSFVEQSKLFTGNPIYYGSVDKFFKRMSGLISIKHSAALDNDLLYKFEDTLGSIGNNYYTDIISKIENFRGDEKAVQTIHDSRIAKIKNALKKNTGIDTGNQFNYKIKRDEKDNPVINIAMVEDIEATVDGETLAHLKELLGNESKPYTKMTEGDGFGFMSPHTERALRFAEGNWTTGIDSNESRYQWEMQEAMEIPVEDRIYIDPMKPSIQLKFPKKIKTTYGSQKPQGFGFFFDKVAVPGFPKLSYISLYPSLIKKYPKLKQFYKRMMTSDTDMMLFVSGNKMGTDMNKLNKDIYSDSPLMNQQLLMQFFSTQQSMKDKAKEKSPAGTQQALLTVTNIYSDNSSVITNVLEDIELMDLVETLANEEIIEYLDENNDPCTPNMNITAEKGLTTNFTKGGKWELIKNFKGSSHSEGGIDISISNGIIKTRRGGKDIKAAHGLVIAANGLVVNENDTKVNPSPEYESMSKVLTERHKHLNWVERAINPDKYPVIDNKDGSFSSHKLAYGTGDNGEAYVYPTIIQNDKGELEELDKNSAWEYAKKTKTAMRIPNIKLAEYYSKNGLIKH